MWNDVRQRSAEDIFEIITAVKIQAEVFWAVTPFSLVVEYHRFGIRCYLHLKGELHFPSP
jgi:hypothetical protein